MPLGYRRPGRGETGRPVSSVRGAFPVVAGPVRRVCRTLSVAAGCGSASVGHTFWSFAGAAFFAAAATLIALAAKDLGVVSETTSILQTFLPGRKSTAEQIKHDERGAAAPDGESAVLVLARRLEEADKLIEAKYAYRLAAEENDDPYALFWLGQQSIEQQKYEEGEEWLLKAMKRGNVDAAFLLGTLAPDGKNSTQHDIAPL